MSLQDNAYWLALDELVSTQRLVIDRPKGSAHPKFPSLIYPLDYGYLDGTSSMDGEGIDVWVGCLSDNALNAIVCTVDLSKGDAEIKLLLGCNEDDIKLILDVHSWGPMSAILVRRPALLKPPAETKRGSGVSCNVTIEGYSADELLSLPDHELDRLLLTEDPIVFSAGTANVLGHFRVHDSVLTVELAHIDGGGEGILQVISAFVERYCRTRCLGEMEWIVHATKCAKPNLRLKRVLGQRGFEIRDVPGIGEVYYLARYV